MDTLHLNAIVMTLLNAIANGETHASIDAVLAEAGLSGLANNIQNVMLFAESGVMSSDQGVVVETTDENGTTEQFHITVV